MKRTFIIYIILAAILSAVIFTIRPQFLFRRFYKPTQSRLEEGAKTFWVDPYLLDSGLSSADITFFLEAVAHLYADLLFPGERTAAALAGVARYPLAPEEAVSLGLWVILPDRLYLLPLGCGGALLLVAPDPETWLRGQLDFALACGNLHLR